MIAIIKSFKYRIYPNKKQQELIQKTFGCTRFVYNYFLDLRIKEYEKSHKTLSFYDTCKILTDLKKELEWLREPDKYSLQNALRNLDDAYKNFFASRTGYPNFKSKKNHYKSYRTSYSNNNIVFQNKYIKLPKLGFVKIKDKQVPSGRILNAVILQESSGHYYCVLCCTDIMIEQYKKTGKNIGLDLGIIDFATMSDGTKIENPRFYEKSEQKLIKLQRELSRKTINSSNWNKTRIKIAKLYKHITNKRKDFLQKFTTQIVKEYDVICIEDLKISEMKGTDFHIRNKRIMDVSWFEFRKDLSYKTEWYGKKLSVIDRYYPSSQKCNICGNLDGKKSLDIRNWTCPCCGTKLDRDINAAINILNEGLRIA